MNPIYAVRNKSTGHFLNIRITDSDNNILWNSYKEKRFWIDGSKEKAICKSDLIPNSEVVEITNLKERKSMCEHDEFEVIYYKNGVLTRQCKKCLVYETRTEGWVDQSDIADCVLYMQCLPPKVG